MSKNKRTPSWKPEANDVIIPLMGPTGAGKSTFINFIAGKEVTTVGHDLKSCTAKLFPVVIDFNLQSDLLKDRRLVLVDTRGFGDTHVDDVDVLGDISSWLEATYDPQNGRGHKGETKLAGIVYLHDISLTRMLGSLKNRDTFQTLCGEGALKRVVLCTTKWSDIYQEDGAMRTKQLKESYWKEMTEGGSTIHKFEDSQKSAWEVISPIIEKDRYGKMDVLQIQVELAEAGRLIPETEVVGRQLLDKFLKTITQASSSWGKELDAQISAIGDWARAMRGSVAVHILRLLDRFVYQILDKSRSTNAMLLVPAVGARLEADVKELIMLFGETETSYEKLLAPSAAKITIFGSDKPEEVRCWSVERREGKPLFVVAAPSFDSHQGGDSAIFEKVRTWLSSSCREDMKFGIIFLRSSVHPSPSEPSHAGPRALELVEQSRLKSKTLFATFASKATGTVERSERSYAGPALELVQQSGLVSKPVVATLANEETATVERSERSYAGPASGLVQQFGLESKTIITLATEGRALELVEQSGLESNAIFATFASDPIEYGFDGSVVSFQDTQEQALKMFHIALCNPVSLDFLLEELQIISVGATSRTGKVSKRGFRSLFL